MPFLDENGAPLRAISLTQVPATEPYFQLNRPIGFREHDSGEISWVPPHVPDDDPTSSNRTDLATVPLMLRAFVSAYGRQSAPAILHDHRRMLTSRPGVPDALRQAEEDDRVFRVALRQQKVPLLRAWLMWAFVAAGRYWLYARVHAVLLIAQVVLGVVVVYGAGVLAWWSPLWWLGVLAPVAGALAWGRHWALPLWLTYGSALIAPLLVLQLCALVPYWLAELLVRELVDRPFFDRNPGPVAVPFVREP